MVYIHKEANKLVDSFAKVDLSLLSHVCFYNIVHFDVNSFLEDVDVINSQLGIN